MPFEMPFTLNNLRGDDRFRGQYVRQGFQIKLFLLMHTSGATYIERRVLSEGLTGMKDVKPHGG